MFIHKTADVSDKATIGQGTKIWNLSQIREGATIGENCILSKNVYVDQGVEIGNNVKIQNNVSIYFKAILEDGVFIGPHVCFTNDKVPRAVNHDGTPKKADDWVHSTTHIKEGASIGANATLTPGITIGKWAMIGSGAVVTKDVPDYALVIGCPARVVDFVCKCGKRFEGNKCLICGTDAPNVENAKIPFVNLHWQYSPLKKEIIDAFTDVFDNSRYIMNKSVKELEEKFANIHRAKHAIAVASGTAALHAAVMALNIREGDEVITSPFTFIATSNVIASTGAKPVFVDIDKDTFNIHPQLIEEKITPRTKAIIPVHLFGQPADMDEIMRIAKKHNLKVIEDAAQSHLAEYKGAPVGTLGDVGCFSFYPAKNLGAFGEGGMILTNNDELAKVIRQKINNGVSPEGPRYLSHTIGLNYRMNELTAAIMLQYFHKMEEWDLKRKANAAYYDQELSDIPSLQLPKRIPNVRHSHHQYTIRTKNRQAMHQFLEQNGISTMIFYPMPLHSQPAYEYLGYKKGDLPVSEKACEEVLSLPIGPHLTEYSLKRITEKIKEFASTSS